MTINVDIIKRNHDGLRLYVAFSFAEVMCVFLPIVVHFFARQLIEHSQTGSCHSPDLLYASVVLPSLAICKWLVAYFSSTRRLRGVHMFYRLILSGIIVLLSTLMLGMFFGEEQIGLWWTLLEYGIPLVGVCLFMAASVDYFNLTHFDAQ